jgi:hypothetical protein
VLNRTHRFARCCDSCLLVVLCVLGVSTCALVEVDTKSSMSVLSLFVPCRVIRCKLRCGGRDGSMPLDRLSHGAVLTQSHNCTTILIASTGIMCTLHATQCGASVPSAGRNALLVLTVGQWHLQRSPALVALHVGPHDVAALGCARDGCVRRHVPRHALRRQLRYLAQQGTQRSKHTLVAPVAEVQAI